MVRDEAGFIEDCLLSLVGVVDEIVLVDTGSRDDTLTIAGKYQIRIEHFSWCNDFSAARNYALSCARHEWILYIDADERFYVPDETAFRAALADRKKAAWKLRLHPRLNWTAYSELRIFRNDARIRFEGEIHERVHPSVNAVCAADGVSIGVCNVAIQHVGYEADQTYKLARNIPLLQAYLAREPSRVYCWWHLGEQFRLAGNEDAARAAWQSGVAAVRAQSVAQTETSDSMVFSALIISRHQAGLPIDELLDQALQLFPSQLTLQWMAGKYALERNETDTARDIFSRLAAIKGDIFFDEQIAYDRALFTHTVQESLALTEFRAGHFALAAWHYRQAANTSPDANALQIKASLAAAKALRTA
ncbi:MAG TPA: glycosyltransferase [Acidocella sp.]|nr:glycosyltransferase [Acidocella sp.]